MEIARRQKIERIIARRFITDAIRSGYTIGVHNGEEMVIRSTNVKAVLAEMFSVDEERLYLYTPGKVTAEGCVFFVYGNEGHDVINDYSGRLEPVLVRTTRLSDRIAARELDLYLSS